MANSYEIIELNRDQLTWSDIKNEFMTAFTPVQEKEMIFINSITVTAFTPVQEKEMLFIN